MDAFRDQHEGGTMKGMTQRPKRGLVAVVAGVVVVCAAVKAGTAEQELRSRQVEALRRTADGNAALATLQRIEWDRDRVDSLVKTLSTALLSAHDLESAVAEVGMLIRSILGRSRGTLESLAPGATDSSSAGVATRAAVRLAFTTDLQGLVSLLAEVVGLATVLSPEWIEVVSSAPMAGPGSPAALKVNLGVTGWFVER